MSEPSFSSLGLSSESQSALARAGYRVPTPIQARAIPLALAGKDVIGCAATGTGKTAAFVLPLVEHLAGKQGIRALVLAPTRELAIQIDEHAASFGAARGVRTALLIGGVSIGPQQLALHSRPQIVIATPGRLIDHLECRNVSLRDIEVLVLDEADRMLDMGFKPQLNRILAAVPRDRQTMLFSATMAGEVAISRGAICGTRGGSRSRGVAPPRSGQSNAPTASRRRRSRPCSSRFWPRTT